ncbi:MAG TPA: KUP/HAK/KT family potassium transporter [Methanoregulaceae archaeon]|nr:KUP/HAK/KT family potassium transporter [Methanoregulaceae archaeon]
MRGGRDDALLSARRTETKQSAAENGREVNVGSVVKSMGLVFGDIGTSPIYTLAVIFLTTPPTEQNILGVLSLIIWTLILIITGQYAWLAMSLGKKGEGGTIVLRELLIPLLRKGRTASFVTLVTILGISLLMGDGVITPAISILSAVEGLELIPGLEGLAQGTLILIAAVIAILLFSFQRRGTERVAFTFGPIMVVWFVVLTLSGLVSLVQAPFMVGAFNPLAGIAFLGGHGIAGFFVLSSVILCATGGEALYADMGHLGGAPIRRAWAFVFVALVINYLGQGAFLLRHQQPGNLLFEMFYAQAPLVYIPLLVLSIAATVIASQAMISGIFSIVYQGITTRILPILKIDYTSSELRSQIYIDIVNWLLLVAVLLVMVVFKASSNLAAAYGLAVTGDMALTGTLITSILFLRGHRGKALIAAGITMIDITFLLATLTKLPAGAYWSLVLAAVPFSIIVIFHFGQKRIYRYLQPIPFQRFLNDFREVYAAKPKIEGTALFFARDFQQVPPYVGLTIFENNIIYEDNVLVSIRTLDRPFGISWEFRKSPVPGIRLFEVRSGYLEMLDVVAIFREAGIQEKTIFYGLDEIVSTNIVWKVFALIKRLSPSFVQFYKLPANRIHGVVTRVEL